MSEPIQDAASLRIDVDVHQGLSASFWQRLPRPWRDMRAPGGIVWPAASLGHTGYRTDVHTSSGERFDAEPREVVERLLESSRIDVAILIGDAGALGIGTHPNGRFALTFVQAYNDWLEEVWLPHDRRLKGSMFVAPLDVSGSVAEIERFGDHPSVVQVLMPASAPRLYGDPVLWPIYEAATGKGLPIAIHPTGGSLTPPTSAGWPSTYLESHTMIATTYMNHMVSLVAQGAFEAIPGFRFVFVEGGVATFAPMLWRMEKNWKAVRAEVPWMTRSPRAYLDDHLRFSTQPIDEPGDPELLRRIFADLRAERSLLYASDWPHWDFDDPEAALLPLPAPVRERILGGNALDLYGKLRAEEVEA